MVKERKNHKPSKEQLENQQNESAKKNTLADTFLDKLQTSLTEFDKLSEEKRRDLYGDQKFLDQFWIYFTEKNPSLIDDLDKKDLPVYLEALEKKGFTLAQLKNNPGKYGTEFGSEKSERYVMQESLKKFDAYCKDSIHAMPAGIFKKFAEEIGFDENSYIIATPSKFKTIDDLYLLWKAFAEKEGYTIKDNQKKNIEQILCPEYNPVERIMVSVAITKLKKILPQSLQAPFQQAFHQPITISSPLQDLVSFVREWENFLVDHAAEIDKPLAKKLDAVIVTNGDIRKELDRSARKFDDPQGYSHRESYFRRIFNKLATRQLFEEVRETEGAVDHYFKVIADTVKGFPPYVNEIFALYPYHDTEVLAAAPALHQQLDGVEQQISEKDAAIATTTSDEERARLQKEKKVLTQQREKIKREAYVQYLATKDASLAQVIKRLIDNRFDFGQLTQADQQLLVNVLVKHKLKDLIANKAPELLLVDEKGLTQFVDDLFDLQKMDLILPTSEGPVKLHFSEKTFLSKKVDHFLSINELSDIKNLPLSFKVEPTPSSEEFLENNAVFLGLFNSFAAKQGPVMLNDAYRVQLTKNGHPPVQGYLSQYPPHKDINAAETDDGTNRYLYSEPITSPSQERMIVTREGGPDGTPVAIPQKEEGQYALDILQKSFTLTGESIGALIFSYVLGQQGMIKTITPVQEAERGKKIGALESYKDVGPGTQEQQPEPENKPIEKKESTDKEKFLQAWKELKGYKFHEKEYEKNFGLVKGTRLLIRCGETGLPPAETGGDAWMQMEIYEIKDASIVFKLSGGEFGLGQYEGFKKEVPMNDRMLANITDVFGEDIYKVPDPKKMPPDKQLLFLKSSGIDPTMLDSSFDKVAWNGSKFTFALGDYKGKDVEYFGYYEPRVGEEVEQETGTYVMYSYQKNPNGTFTVRNETKFLDEKTKKETKYIQDMDYNMFLLFVASKKLQPKTKEQAERIKSGKERNLQDNEVPQRRTPFSINNIIGFFKTGATKIKDSIKKYDEEKTEELVDLMTHQGQLYRDIGMFLGNFSSRMKDSFETAGMEHFLERDNRIWKKIEKWQKFYEDQHFTTIYNLYLQPMLSGKVIPKPHYKVAALMLTMIKKGKGPYNRNPELVGTGTWINLLMGPQHQARYLAMRDKKLRELQQNSGTFGSVWSDQIQNELVELEMKYIVHVIDGRQLSVDDKGATENALCAKRSRAFSGKLEEAYTEYFTHNFVETAFNKIPKTTNFEFARFEYFRLLADRPQQAIPFLKTMAQKAVSPSQWKTFESAVMAGMLSGIFLTMVPSDTKGWIKDICRARGFLPGLRVKDINQQTKLARLLDICTDNDFTKSTNYNPSGFSLGNMVGVQKKGTKGFVGRTPPGQFKSWLDKENNLNVVSNFLQFTGKAKNEKTLIEIYDDPHTPEENKALLKQFINNSLEKNEDVDQDVLKNRSALSESVFTKSQSVIEKVIKFQGSSFSGKDNDEIQAIQAFWREVGKLMPKGPLTTSQVEYFLEKFFNRFGERGFQSNLKSKFLRRLKSVEREMKVNPTGADDILRYSIVGTIIDNSGNGAVPSELQTGLDAFKSFFKDNLSQILRPSMIEKTLGPQHLVDVDPKNAFEIGAWGEYVQLKDLSYLMTLSGEERKEKVKLNSKYKNTDRYLNEDLYALAEKLSGSNGLPNRFKKYLSGTTEKKEETKVVSINNGIAIQNPHVIKKLKDTLEGGQGNLPGSPTDEEYSSQYYSGMAA